MIHESYLRIQLGTVKVRRHGRDREDHNLEMDGGVGGC